MVQQDGWAKELSEVTKGAPVYNVVVGDSSRGLYKINRVFREEGLFFNGYKLTMDGITDLETGKYFSVVTVTRLEKVVNLARGAGYRRVQKGRTGCFQACEELQLNGLKNLVWDVVRSVQNEK